MTERAAQPATRGEAAERLVVDRLRAAVAPPTVVLENVHWLLRDHGRERKGEADVVVADPARGILVLEVKSGEVCRRDGTWWVGKEPLDRSPFRQASDNRFALIRKLYELPSWPSGLKPIAGEGVAFPSVDLDTMRGRLGLLGLDAEHDLIADQSMFVDGEAGRHELLDFLARAFDLWSGGADTQPPGAAVIALLQSTFIEPFELRSQLRNEVVDGERQVVRLTDGQAMTLRAVRRNRRVDVRGGAGTGKTMFAIETASRLAREGFETLLVCFNSPLARMLAEETATAAADTGRLTVGTFHQICEDLGRGAGVLPPKPEPVTAAWFAETLPRALDDAIAAMSEGGRYHAIVVDEGQDFDPEWLASLDELLVTPGDDVFYVFHDPAQAIYRDDAVGQLGLETVVELDLNCRNAQPIHAVVARLAEGGLATEALRVDGRAPELIAAETTADATEALRSTMHRLRSIEGEQVNPWDIAVLTGVSLDESAVWAQRRFGNEVLGNAAYDDAGRPLGLAAHLVPRLPDDVILCDSIRRFKGLERPVIVLVELLPDDVRLARLLYIGASRARQHLVVIAPTAVLDVLR